MNTSHHRVDAASGREQRVATCAASGRKQRAAARAAGKRERRVAARAARRLATVALLPVALLPVALALCPARAAAQDFASSLLLVPDASQRFALRDVNGDGRRDLIGIGLDGLSLRLLTDEGAYPEEPSGRFPWPSETVGWYLADLDGDGGTEVVLLVDGSRVLSVAGDAAGAFLPPREVLTDASGFLPRGIRRVNIVRDVNGDGLPDLVLPGAGRFRIHLQHAADAADASDAAGSEPRWTEPLTVSFRPSLSLELGNPARLDARFAEDIRIPWFSLQDLDGDGRTDLISQTEDETLFHIADPGLPEAPTWHLDLAELRAEIARPEGIDFDNLIANVEPQVNWKTADLDGVPPNDLVIQQGGKFSIYLGGSRGPKLDAPDQVLKASGNVLYFLLRDVDKDGRPDLQLLRAETVSLTDALRLLVVPGSLEFDIFTYRDELAAGGDGSDRAVFSRKPSTKATVSLRVPALLGFISTVDEMKTDYEKRKAVPAQAAALDADGLMNDVVDVRGDSLAIWKNSAPADLKQTVRQRFESFDIDELLEDYATRKLDQLDDGGTLSIGLEDIRTLLVTPGWDLRQAVKSRAPDVTVPLPFPGSDVQLRIEDLDGDGRSDIIALGRNAEMQQLVFFLRTR